ncbi:MAG: RES family NAD+ phosphorylase [Burkholderiaceae bacterium]|nr:RES family NAD+ phosphorylase [Burkholderiaceae bacterium]
MSLEGLPYGSTLGPGRWHLPPASGLPVVYAASSRALAQLEKRVHANGVAPVKQALIRLELPLGAIILDAHNDLALESPRWRLDEGYTQGVGVDWLQSTASLGLWVPSVVEPQERNLLINPAHPQYTSIAVVKETLNFEFDPRSF